MTKAVEERTSTEMVEVLKGGSFYINTSHSSPTFALGAGMQKMDFTNFAETKAEKVEILRNMKAVSYLNPNLRNIIQLQTHCNLQVFDNDLYAFHN